MTEATHTPGPWTAGHFSGVVGLPVMAQPDPKKNSLVICGVRGAREDAEANARLIAAAPDLLAALRECAIRCRYDGDYFHDRELTARRDASWAAADMAYDAIAKATGDA